MTEKREQSSSNGSIAADDDLYRRIPPQLARPDRPSSQNFTDRNLSVEVAKLTTAQATMQPVSHLPDFTKWRLASLKAGIPREEGLEVYSDPLPENQAHAIIFGDKPKRISRKLALACRWIKWNE